MRLVICLTLVLLSGCRILVSSSEGGTVLSRSGLNDCRNGGQCVIEVTPGRRFSDSFAAIPEPGYRFAGWQAGPQHLCGDSLLPCRLENIPGSQVRADTTLELAARFVRDSSFRVIPDHFFYSGAAGQAISVPVAIQGDGGAPVSLTVERFKGSVDFDPGSSQLTLRPAPVDQVTVENIKLVATAGEWETHSAFELTVYPATASGEGVTLVGQQRGAGVHLVVVADGYRASQTRTLRINALQFFEELLADPGIGAHMSAWNLHVIETPSVQTGADAHFGSNDRDTAFGSGFNCHGLKRLLCADDAAVMDKLLRDFPHYHQAVVMVNSIEYGGSGGEIAVFNQTNPRIAVHELGHSFADLADEYVQDSIAGQFGAGYVEGTYANVSRFNDAALVPWSHWIEDTSNPPRSAGAEGVGVFEGAFYHSEGYYRPLSTSLMLAIDQPFGPVNAEQWISRIYDRIGVVRSSTPAGATLDLKPDSRQRFRVELSIGNGVQSVNWFVNGEEHVASRDSTRFDWLATSGQHTIAVRVDDRSGAVRRASRANMQFQRSWQVAVNP